MEEGAFCEASNAILQVEMTWVIGILAENVSK